MGVENNIPEGWVDTTLGDISTRKQYGYTESASNEKIGPKFLRITDIQNDFISWDKVPYCPISDEDFTKYKLQVGDVVIARTGNSTGATATIKENIHSVFASYLIRFQINKQLADYDFVDFLLRSKLWDGFVNSVKSGSAQGGANANDFALFPIYLPPLQEQKAIAKVLTAFDDKIELLQAQNKTLVIMAQTIFKEWFGKYQVGDELPDGWRVGKLGDVMDIFDSKRVPLSKAQREAMRGDYRYYGATKVMDYVNDYLFDGIYLLFAEDGSVMDDDGYPFLQYVWGKFWVNNHTHILKGKNSFSTELLYVLCKKMKVAGIVNGAVQLKINQRNLLSKEIILPNDSILEKVDNTIQPLFNKLRINSSQIQSLTKTRDTLLPKLMSGQVRVKNIKHTADA